ncbi:MAG: hypothetical protein DHS20C18_11220 [Saprospiraceae bacterium]|nr:MAG: hypothetical protein DHS20C18_11220 [Saprospiraceae bacterium]
MNSFKTPINKKNSYTPLPKGGLYVFLLLGSLLFSLTISAQRNLTLFGLPEVMQTSNISPAFFPSAKLTVGLPGLSNVNYLRSNNSFSAKDLGLKGFFPFGGDPNYAMALSNTNPMNDAFLDATVELFNAGYRLDRHFFRISLTDHVEGLAQYPFGYLDMKADNQKGALVRSKTYDLSGMNINYNHYRALGLGYAFQYNERLSIGARFSLLTGLEHLSTTNSGLMLRLPAEAGGILVANNMTFWASGLDLYDGARNIPLFVEGNYGFSMDIGAEYQVNERIRVFGSVVNIGYLKYNIHNDIYNFNSTDIDPESTDDFVGDLEDEIFDRLIDNPVRRFHPYYRELTPQVYAGGHYAVDGHQKIGFLLNLRKYRDYTSYLDFGLAASYSNRVNPWLTLTGNYALYNKNFINLGFGASAELGPCQVYLATDNVISLFTPSSTKNTHFNVGVNFVFGRMERPDPTKDIAENKMEDPADTTSAPIVELEPPPMLDHSGLVSKPSDARYFLLKVKAKDKATDEIVDATYVDIYRIGLGNKKELVRTNRYGTGEFMLRMDKSEEPHELYLRCYGYEPVTFPFYPTGTSFDQTFVLDYKEGEIPLSASVEPEVDTIVEEEIVEEMPAEPIVEVEDSDAVSADGKKKERIDFGPHRLTQRTSLRQGPSSSATSMDRLDDGDRVIVLEKTNDSWWKVEYNKRSGWVKAALLTPSF